MRSRPPSLTARPCSAVTAVTAPKQAAHLDITQRLGWDCHTRSAFESLSPGAVGGTAQGWDPQFFPGSCSEVWV